MIDEVTKLAAFISNNLTKVDRNMLNQSSSGPANQINVHNFVRRDAPKPVPQPVAAPLPQPELIPMPPPTIGQAVPANSSVVPSVADSKSIELIVNHLDRIATELGKINKKMTSIQKHLSKKNNERFEDASRLNQKPIQSDIRDIEAD